MPRHGGYRYNQPHKEYWTQRGKEKLSECFKDSDEVMKYLTETYKRGLSKFIGDYDNLLSPFVLSDGTIDLAKLAKARELDEKFHKKLQRLENEIDAFCKSLNDKELKTITNHLQKTYKWNVEETLKDLNKDTDGVYLLNRNAIETAVRMPQTKDGREFSDRIWNNLKDMEVNLRRTVTDGIAQGKSIPTMRKEFKRIFGNSTYNTDRIIRTETMATYTKANLNTFKEVGIDTVEIIGERDACEVCGEYIGTRQKVENVRLGINVPPYHPFCKCCAVPVVDWNKWL